FHFSGPIVDLVRLFSSAERAEPAVPWPRKVRWHYLAGGGPRGGSSGRFRGRFSPGARTREEAERTVPVFDVVGERFPCRVNRVSLGRKAGLRPRASKLSRRRGRRRGSCLSQEDRARPS